MQIMLHWNIWQMKCITTFRITSILRTLLLKQLLKILKLFTSMDPHHTMFPEGKGGHHAGLYVSISQNKYCAELQFSVFILK